MMAEAGNRQELETDVVVIGYGGAGATAAITAHDSGARVIILEKMPGGGGNTRVSGGVIFTPTSREGVPYALQYLEVLSSGTTEKEILETFVENAIRTKDWIQEIGGEAGPYPPFLQVFYPTFGMGACYPNVPGAEHITHLCIKGSETETKSERLWKLLSTNVERRGIKVLTSTPAKELFTNEKGEVTGVMAETNGKKVYVKVRRAVILTCGGFGYNEAMKKAFLPLRPFYAYGNPGNTGDGIIMAQKVGAALWHMTVLGGHLCFKAPEYPSAFPMRYYSERFIYVNRQGRRFCSELGRERHTGYQDVAFVDSMVDTSHPGYRNIPAYVIFDEVTRRKGPLYMATMGYSRHLYEWSLDNSKEIAKGWIAQAKTIGELARRISVDESSLEDTVARYNEFCKAGKDADFGRSRETLGPIETPPFYAIELWPGMGTTNGGLRRDKEARVLNWEGKPILRLYAAGELGSIQGFLLEAGAMIGDCLAFGRIAGRNAAAEKPWSQSP